MADLRITFRLDSVRDKDLVAWINNLGWRERSCFIRHMLRRGLKVFAEKGGNPERHL
ncbi:MAG: hypothetical protein ACM3WV_12410 [Bacillota bacterium]